MTTDIKTMVRANDPITSVIAADRALKFKQTHKEKILDAINFFHQATADEISRITGLTVVQVDRRMVEIEREGKAVVAQCNGSNYIRNGFRVWEHPMSDKGREIHIRAVSCYIGRSMSFCDISEAKRLTALMNGLIRCRSPKQIKKMEQERGLV